jgi:DNA-binding protein HU-beta
MAKKAATPTTVTLKHLAAALSEEHELSKKSAEAILNDLVGRITKHLKKGERIRIVGPHGPQPRYRRSNPHQGQQEGCLPRGQGAEGSRLTRARSQL